MAEEKTRYSDAELEEFKQLILTKLESARSDYELLHATITHTSGNDIEDTSPTYKVLEEGAATLSKEENGRLAMHQMKFHTELNHSRWGHCCSSTYGLRRGQGRARGLPYRVARFTK